MHTTVFDGDIRGNRIVIRYLTENDAPLLQDYINEVSREQTYITYQGEQVTFEEEVAYVKTFMTHMMEHRAVKLLAFHGGSLIGVADLYLKGRVEGHVGVFGITMRKPWRNKGVGSCLMDYVLKEGIAHIKGLQIITLGVFANNAIAQRMYTKKGFSRYGLLPGGLLHKGEFVDHVYMYKKV